MTSAAIIVRTGLRSTIASLALFACEPDKPPAPAQQPSAPRSSPGGAAADAAPPKLDPKTDAFVLTYAGDRGTFADGSKIDAVPEASRGLVRVKLLEGPEAPAGTVWVANLKEAAEDGTYALSTVPRASFEELALGEGLTSKAEVPEGLEPPEQVAAPAGSVVVYKTSWCGVCGQLEKYLKKKGVEYEAKDIEKDRSAAAELAAMAKGAGVAWKGSVPVISVGGELIVGFDRRRLEKIL